MYELTMIFNGQTFHKKVKDVREAILSVKPDFLYTEMYLTVKWGENERERQLNLTQGKKLFNNEDFLDVFISNLFLK